MTLRLRLSLLIALVSFLAMLFFGALAYILFARDQYRQLVKFLERDIERAQSLFVNPTVGAKFSIDQGLFIQQFVDKQDKVIIPPNPGLDLPLVLETKVLTLQEKSFLVSSRPWKLSSGLELGTLRVALDISDALAFRKSLLRSLIFSGVVMTLLAWGIGVWLLQRSLKPLLNLVNETKYIDPAHPRTVNYQGPSDEVSELAKAINHSLEGIRRYQKAERESLADIAHELSACTPHGRFRPPRILI